MAMSNEVQAFIGYANAFEDGFKPDDWTLVDHLFDENIVWSVAGL